MFLCVFVLQEYKYKTASSARIYTEIWKPSTNAPDVKYNN